MNELEHIAMHLITDKIWDIVQYVDEFVAPSSDMTEMELANYVYNIVMDARDEAAVETMAVYYGEIE